jgi:recombinational DNA repair protein (RecF pathway)
MQFSSEGYIVKIRNHGEKSAIVTVVCPEHGKVTGYVTGALGKRQIGIFS